MRISKFVLILTSLLAASAVSPVLAAPSDLELAAAADAERRGAQMFAYDQAAWRATDRFQADLVAARISDEALVTANLRGYIAEPADGGGVLVTFYGRRDDTRWAFARYLYAEGKVSGRGILAEGVDRALSPLALRIANAREKAIAEMRKPDHGLCSDTPPNTTCCSGREPGRNRGFCLDLDKRHQVLSGGRTLPVRLRCCWQPLRRASVHEILFPGQLARKGWQPSRDSFRDSPSRSTTHRDPRLRES